MTTPAKGKKDKPVTKAQARPATYEINFDYPVKVGDEEIKSVTMRRQTVADMLDAETMGPTETAQGQEVALFGILTGIPVEDLTQWDMLDYQKLTEGYLFLTYGNRANRENHSEEQSSASPAGQDGAKKKSEK